MPLVLVINCTYLKRCCIKTLVTFGFLKIAPCVENRAEQRAFAISAVPGLGADPAVLSLVINCTFSIRCYIKTTGGVIDLSCCNRTMLGSVPGI